MAVTIFREMLGKKEIFKRPLNDPIISLSEKYLSRIRKKNPDESIIGAHLMYELRI